VDDLAQVVHYYSVDDLPCSRVFPLRYDYYVFLFARFRIRKAFSLLSLLADFDVLVFAGYI
jgi:hypothetical protein